MNLNLKKMPMIAVSLLAASSIFGQMNQKECKPCNPCQPPRVCKPVPQPKCGPLQAPQPPIVCAYNAPTEIFIGMECDIDFFVTASFIYWQPSQDNMSVAYTDKTSLFRGVTATIQQPNINGDYVEMDFDFKPGFQVGLGMNLSYDDWVAYIEYTRVHGKHHISSNGPLTTPSLIAAWGNSFLMGPSATVTSTAAGGTVLGVGGGQVFSSVSAGYKNHLDFGDIEMSRVYYVGKKLVFHSAFGARAAWILQTMDIRYTNNTGATNQDPSGVLVSFPSIVDVTSRSHSWGVGPRAGVMMDWMFGCGFRFFGSTYADVLYTKYKLQNKTTLTPFLTSNHLTAGVPVSVIDRDKVRVLRTHLDLEMGFGWGDYFDTNDWHFDLSLAYGFQVFFDQNMFRRNASPGFIAGGLTDTGNLYVQGLTVTARFDF